MKAYVADYTVKGETISTAKILALGLSDAKGKAQFHKRRTPEIVRYGNKVKTNVKRV